MKVIGSVQTGNVKVTKITDHDDNKVIYVASLLGSADGVAITSMDLK